MWRPPPPCISLRRKKRQQLTPSSHGAGAPPAIRSCEVAGNGNSPRLTPWGRRPAGHPNKRKEVERHGNGPTPSCTGALLAAPAASTEGNGNNAAAVTSWSARPVSPSTRPSACTWKETATNIPPHRRGEAVLALPVTGNAEGSGNDALAKSGRKRK